MKKIIVFIILLHPLSSVAQLSSANWDVLYFLLLKDQVTIEKRTKSISHEVVLETEDFVIKSTGEWNGLEKEVFGLYVVLNDGRSYDIGTTWVRSSVGKLRYILRNNNIDPDKYNLGGYRRITKWLYVFKEVGHYCLE
jgi:hypothetical protein